MECDFLVRNSKNRKMDVAVKAKIEDVSDGSSPHCVGALDLMLEKVFQAKRRSQYAQLRCTDSSRCSWANKFVPYSSVESTRTGCPRCGSLMTCDSCQYKRAGSYSSCQLCGKKFI